MTTGSFLALHNLSSVITAGSCGIEGEDDSYDFGTGAGFYVDATEEKWKTNYRMFSYITKEVLKYLSCKHRLPKLKIGFVNSTYIVRGVWESLYLYRELYGTVTDSKTTCENNYLI